MGTTNPRLKLRILLIDDDPAIATAVGLQVQSHNIDTLAAFSGEQGIWLAVTEKPDVIITDMRMANGDGEFVVDCLKSRIDTCTIPIIVLTGQRDDDLKRRMFTLGVEHYLHKPLKFDKLLEILARYKSVRACAY